MAAAARHFRCRCRQLVGLAGGFRILLDRARQLFHGGSGLFKVAGLLFRSVRQILVAGRNLPRSHRNGIDTDTHVGDDLAQADHHVVEGLLQAGYLVGAFGLDVRGQVTLGHGIGQLDGPLERSHDGAGEEKSQRYGNDNAKQREADGESGGRLEGCRRLVGIILRVADLPFDHGVDSRCERTYAVGEGAKQQSGSRLVVAALLGVHRLDEVVKRRVVLLKKGDGNLVQSAALFIVKQRRSQVEIGTGFLVKAAGIGQQVAAGLVVRGQDGRFQGAARGDHAVFGARSELEAGEILVISELRAGVHVRRAHIANDAGGCADERSYHKGAYKALVN